MKKVVVYILSLVFFIACLNMKQQSFDKAALLSLENNIDTIIALLKSSDTLVEKDKLQELFSASRKNYKKVEPFAEYYFQGLMNIVRRYQYQHLQQLHSLYRY